MHEYTFDVWIQGVAHVKAKTEEEAVERLRLVDASTFAEAGRRGVRITEISLAEDSNLRAVDGKDVDESEADTGCCCADDLDF